MSLGSQIYVAKLNPTGSGLIYAATFGPRYQTVPAALAVDEAGGAVIAGTTFSSAFPVTPNAAVQTFQPQNNDSASFITALNANGTALLYSTFGNPGEQPLSLALTPAGEPELAETDASSNVLIRRYNGDASAIVFETPLHAHAPLPSPLAVNSSGMATFLSGTDMVDLPAVQPVGSCPLSGGGSPISGAAGYLVRLDATGKVIQSSFLPDLSSPTFFSIHAETNSASTVVWDFAPPAGASGAGELRLLTLTPQSNATVTLSCAGNGATLRNAPLAPGEIISLFGSGIGPAAPVIPQPGADHGFPNRLANTEVTFDGVPAPLIYVSSTQINAVTPFNLSTAALTQMCVNYEGQSSNCMAIQANVVAPGIFRDPANPGYAAAVNQDGTINSQQNPAPVGSIVSLYVTGLGAITPAVPDGSITGFPLPVQDLPPDITAPSPDIHDLIGLPADVLYAGPAPFEIAGLSQINVRVPPAGGFFTLQASLPGQPIMSDSALIWTK